MWTVPCLSGTVPCLRRTVPCLRWTVPFRRQTVLCLRRLVADLSPRRVGFYPSPVPVGQFFSPLALVLPLSVPFHQWSILVFIYLLLLTGESLELSTSNALPEIGERWIEEYFLFLVFRRPANLLKHSCIGAANVMFRWDIFFAHKMTRVV
jgi:hypothetical protein